jgi:hypothetical protein
MKSENGEVSNKGTLFYHITVNVKLLYCCSYKDSIQLTLVMRSCYFVSDNYTWN